MQIHIPFGMNLQKFIPALSWASSVKNKLALDGVGDKSTDHHQTNNPYSEKLEKLKALMELPEPTRVDLNFVSSLTLRPYPFTIIGVASFIKDNSLNSADLKDIIFGIVLVKLVSIGAIFPDLDDFSEDKVTKNDIGNITDGKLEVFAGWAKNMMVVALHVYSRGNFCDDISWYNSYCAVKGAYLSHARFTNIARMIINSGSIGDICKIITLGELRSENKVLRYRIERLSSPSLVKAALDAMPYEVILKHFNAAIISEYRKFDEGGIAAQIAAGPLSVYCKGDVDALLGDKIPGDVRIVDLKPIESVPYDARTLRMVYIILEEVKYSFGRWFQCEKAMKRMNVFDMYFRSIVKAVNAKIKEKADAVDITDGDIEKLVVH